MPATRSAGTAPTAGAVPLVPVPLGASESLRLQRPDRGEPLALLGRDDIVAYLNRMAFLERQRKVTLKTRREQCLDLQPVRFLP